MSSYSNTPLSQPAEQSLRQLLEHVGGFKRQIPQEASEQGLEILRERINRLRSVVQGTVSDPLFDKLIPVAIQQWEPYVYGGRVRHRLDDAGTLRNVRWVAQILEDYIKQRLEPREPWALGLIEEMGPLQVFVTRNTELSQGILLDSLRNAEGLYIGGDWKASIGAARSFIEQILRDVAAFIAQTRGETPSLNQPSFVRKYLLDSGFFEEDEKKDLVDGIYGYLSKTGSHPGVVEQRTARLVRTILLSFAYYLLEKFEDWKQKQE